MKLATRLATAMVGAAALACASLHALSAPTLDTTFGGTGIVVGPPNAPGSTSVAGEGVITDRHDRVLFLRTVDDTVNKTTDLVRLKSNGNVDSTFGAGGAAPVAVNPSAAVLPSLSIALDRRRILVAYHTDIDYSIFRFLEDGAPDAAFGAGGVVTIPATFPHPILDVRAQDDRKVLLVGATGSSPSTQQVTLYRLTEAGALDATFGTAGVVYTAIPGGTGSDRGTGLGLQPDGKILVTGRSRRSATEVDAIVLRYLTNGNLDPAFGSGGIAIVSFGDKQALGRRLSLQPDGKIVVTGTVIEDPSAVGSGRAGLLRLNADGTLDVGFGSAGTIEVPLGAHGGAVFQLVRQPDDRPVVVGYRNRAALFPGSGDPTAIVMRYTAFGTLDTTWDGDGIYELGAPGFPDSNGSSIAIDDHDRVVVTGSVTSGTDIRWFVARLKTGPKMVCKP